MATADFALDISGTWSAKVPRKGGMVVVFNFTLLTKRGGVLEGDGEQLHDSNKWFFTLGGSIEGDEIKLSLTFPPQDLETWEGEIIGDSIKVKYQRQGWESQTFTMTRGHQRPTPPVAAGGSGAGSGSTSRACVIS